MSKQIVKFTSLHNIFKLHKNIFVFAGTKMLCIHTSQISFDLPTVTLFLLNVQLGLKLRITFKVGI